jgi:hypothetical protein
MQSICLSDLLIKPGILNLTNEHFAIARSFLISMNTKFNAEETAGNLHIDLQNVRFATMAFQLFIDNESFFPSVINAASVQNDLVLFEQLKELTLLNRELSEKLERAVSVAGNNVYTTAATIFRLVELAKDAHVNGSEVLYEQLMKALETKE